MKLSHRRLLLSLTLSTLFVPAVLASSAQRAQSEPSFMIIDGKMVYCPSPEDLARRERATLLRQRSQTVPRIPKEMADVTHPQFDMSMSLVTRAANIYHPDASAMPADADTLGARPEGGAGASFNPRSFGGVPSINPEALPALSVPMRRSPTSQADTANPGPWLPSPAENPPHPRPLVRQPNVRPQSLEERDSGPDLPAAEVICDVVEAKAPEHDLSVSFIQAWNRLSAERSRSPDDPEVVLFQVARRSRFNASELFAKVAVPSTAEIEAASERAKSDSPFRSMFRTSSPEVMTAVARVQAQPSDSEMWKLRFGGV